MVAESDAPERKALRCPECGSRISADLQYTSMSYSEHRDLVGYECEDCPAEWDQNGNPR